MQYDTNNLDEATYLALQGYRFKATRTGPGHANFNFTVADGFEEVCSRFWKGEVTVQLHRWLATRTAIKNEVAGQPIAVKHAAAPSIVPSAPVQVAEVRPGLAYWYREGAEIKCAVFGNRIPHTGRLSKGNFYRSREDATLKMNSMQVA